MMPYGDGTGPAGAGPMTGRAAGFCAGNGMPGYMNPAPGRGCGRGYGYGRGRGGYGMGMAWRHGRGRWQTAPVADVYPAYPPAPVNEESEKSWLEAAVKDYQSRLDGLKKRLEEISKKKES